MALAADLAWSDTLLLPQGMVTEQWGRIEVEQQSVVAVSKVQSPLAPRVNQYISP